MDDKNRLSLPRNNVVQYCAHALLTAHACTPTQSYTVTHSKVQWLMHGLTKIAAATSVYK